MSLSEDELAKTSGAACQSFTLSCCYSPVGIDVQIITRAVIAGAETTSALIQYFIYAMLMYPDVQKKAQDELERVVGHDRLPTAAE